MQEEQNYIPETKIESEDQATQISSELDYIASLLADLQTMADRSGYNMLAYLIDIAQTQANDLLAEQNQTQK